MANGPQAANVGRVILPVELPRYPAAAAVEAAATAAVEATVAAAATVAAVELTHIQPRVY